MVNAAIVVFIDVIAYNIVFQFFIERADFLLKWRNQIYICNGIVCTDTVMVSTGEKIIQFCILILDAPKIEFLDIMKVNARLNAFKVVSIN